MKFIATALLALSLTATAASAYEGGWSTNNNVGGSEILDLGDNDDDTYLRLYGTKGWCGRRGDTYATMRSVIESNYWGSGQVSWWIASDCGNTVRVCVEGNRGQVACSTYRYGGWY